MSCTTVGWLALLAIAVGGWCLYRRWQIRLYRKAKRDALAAVNLDISNRKT